MVSSGPDDVADRQDRRPSLPVSLLLLVPPRSADSREPESRQDRRIDFRKVGARLEDRVPTRPGIPKGHGADAAAAGHTFIPLVFETLGTLREKGKAWFSSSGASRRRRLARMGRLSSAEEQERGRRAELSARWQQRFSTILQRGNARAIITRARASRTLMGIRVRGQWGRSELDVGLGADEY